MEDPTTQPSAATTNGVEVNIECNLETPPEVLLNGPEPAQLISRHSSVDAADDGFENCETKKSADTAIVSLEKVTPLTDESRASLDEALKEDDQSAEPEKSDEPCQTENFGEKVSVSLAISEEVFNRFDSVLCKRIVSRVRFVRIFISSKTCSCLRYRFVSPSNDSPRMK